MALDDVKKKILITKSSLYGGNIHSSIWVEHIMYIGSMMPYRTKNVINTFSHIMANIFKEWTSQFLKVFVDGINIHSSIWVEH